MSLLMDALRRAEAEKRAAAARLERAAQADAAPETFELSLEPAPPSGDNRAPASITGEFALPMDASQPPVTRSSEAGDEDATLVDELALQSQTLGGNRRADVATLGRPELVTPHTVFIASNRRSLSRYTAGLAIATTLVVASLGVLSWRYYRAMTPPPLIAAPQEALRTEQALSAVIEDAEVPAEIVFPASAPVEAVVEAVVEAPVTATPGASAARPAAAPDTAQPMPIEAARAVPDPTVSTPASELTAASNPATTPTLKDQELGNGDLRIERSRPSHDVVAARLAAAFAAFERGDFALARQGYATVLANHPAQIDAHLGLGAVALATNQSAEAHEHYARVLAQTPEHPVATAAMFLLEGGKGGFATTGRVKMLIDRGLDAPYLHFALGNFHAREARWGDAQQAYFAAFTGQPRNADYAFNLAVSLDHLGQRKAALDFYRKALELRGPRSAFGAENAAARIAALADS
jgi:tetratricopeptide (TPR) repeat protein